MTQQAPPEILQRILIAVRGRGFDEAALQAAQALTDYPDDSRLPALAGAIEMQRGQFPRAVQLLAAAQLANPNDITIRANLAEAHYNTGDFEAALALCDNDAIAGDASGRLLRLGAYFAQECNQLDRAALLYGQIVASTPDDWSSWNNLGNVLGSLERFDEAISALQKAAEFQPRDRTIRTNLSNTLAAKGDLEPAIAGLISLADEDKSDHEPMLALSVIYRKQGREDDTYAAMAEAARRAPGIAQIRSDYGQEAAKRQDHAIAESEFEAALAIDPQLGPPYVGLASLFERMNNEERLDPLLVRAKAAGTDSQSIAYIEALVCKRGNDYAAALAALDQSGEVVVAGRRLHLRGVMLDRLKRYDDAFAAFDAMNAHWLEDPTQPSIRAQLYRDAVSRDTALVTPEWCSSWTAPAPADHWPTPTFLVGFPRSGTTLLDTMLMREPRALVLEEEPILAELEMRVGGIEALPGLDAHALREGREYYFGEVAKLEDLKPGSFVVDKHPLHLNKVPVIQRFFPDARYILALRHPCDVLLSCYLTNFQINNAMANFLDLGTAAQLYDQTFSYWEKARKLFNLPVKTVVYERLVDDTKRELRPLFDWLGLDWPGDETDHREAARARGVVYTASYAQVTEPIYTRARGRWHSYREHLAPILETMRPWAEKFGYSLEDGRVPAWPDYRQGEA